MNTIVQPDTTIVVHRDAQKPPTVLKNLRSVEIADGKEFHGDGFTFGFGDPSLVKVYRDGKVAKFSDAKIVLFQGGRPGQESERQKLAEVVENIEEQPHSTEIVDDLQVNIVDNDASEQIEAYSPPIDVPDSDSQAVVGAGERIRGSSDTIFPDDLQRRLVDEARASITSDGRPLDDFDQKWQLANTEKDRLIKVAPFARIQPPSITNGILGGQVQLSSGERKTVAYWVGDDHDTVPVTVTLAALNPPTPNIGTKFAATGLLNPYAVVKFGTRAFSTEIEVDIARGTQFTVSGSSVVVDVVMDPASSFLTASSMSLLAMLSFYPTVQTLPSTRTLVEYDVDTTEQIVFIVPAFAKNVTILPLTDSGSGFQVTMISNPGNPAGLYTFIQDQPNTTLLPPLKLPLIGGISYIAVTNNSNANDLTITALFELGI